MSVASFEEVLRRLAVEEAEHRVRKAKAEADLAELSFQHGRDLVALERVGSVKGGVS